MFYRYSSNQQNTIIITVYRRPPLRCLNSNFSIFPWLTSQSYNCIQTNEYASETIKTKNIEPYETSLLTHLEAQCTCRYRGAGKLCRFSRLFLVLKWTAY